MAASFGNGNNSSSNPTPQTPPQTPPASGAPAGFGGFGLNPLFSRNAGSDNITEMVEKWNKQIAAKQLGIKLSVMTEIRRACTFTLVLIMMGGQKANGRNTVAVHTLIAEPQEMINADHTYQVGNQQVEIPAVAGNIYTDDLWKRIERRVIELNGDVDVADAYASVVPREMPYTNDQHVSYVLMLAVEAVYRTLIDEVGAQHDVFSVTNPDLVPRNYRMNSRIIVNSQDAINAVGLPVRADLQIVVAGSESANQNDPYGSGGREYTAVDGYINLMYQRPQPAAYGMPPVSQHYYPQFVMTNVESRFGPSTLELFLLALHSVSNVGKNWAWVAQFLPRMNGNNPLKSLDGIGLEVPQLTGDPSKPALLDTRALSTDDFYRLVTMAVHPNLTISMDIEECGSTSFLSTQLLKAAIGNPQAISAIIRAADNLTGNHFSTMFKGGAILADDQNRIHLGYFYNQDRERVDIRHLDYLAVLNHTGADDIAKVTEWDGTFYDYGTEMDLRLHRRTKLIKDILTEPRFKGYARRVTWTADFINALNAAVIKAGCTIVPSNTAFEFNNNQRHMFQNIGQFAIDPRQLAGVFNYGGGVVNNPMANMGRWANR